MKQELIKLIPELVWKIIRHRLVQKYHQFLKYCIGGGIGFIIYFGTLYGLTEFANLWYLASATVAFFTSAAANYFFQRYITFKDNKTDKVWQQFLVFSAVAIVGLLINNSILYIAVEFLNIWYVIAAFMAAAIVLIWNFIANKRITFRHI